MKTIMSVDNLTTTESLEHFLVGNQAIAFRVLSDKSDRYEFVQKILVKFQYLTGSKNEKLESSEKIVFAKSKIAALTRYDS